MASIQELRVQLNQRIEDIKRRDELIYALERELDEKDALIRHLKNEIDKFQQVVRPLTKDIVSRKICPIDGGEVRKVPENRPKRQAISAEPILNGTGDLPIVKIPKTPE